MFKGDDGTVDGIAELCLASVVKSAGGTDLLDDRAEFKVARTEILGISARCCCLLAISPSLSFSAESVDGAVVLYLEVRAVFMAAGVTAPSPVAPRGLRSQQKGFLGQRQRLPGRVRLLLAGRPPGGFPVTENSAVWGGTVSGCRGEHVRGKALKCGEIEIPESEIKVIDFWNIHGLISDLFMGWGMK